MVTAYVVTIVHLLRHQNPTYHAESTIKHTSQAPNRHNRVSCDMYKGSYSMCRVFIWQLNCYYYPAQQSYITIAQGDQ